MKTLKAIFKTITNPVGQAKDEVEGKKFWTQDVGKKKPTQSLKDIKFDESEELDESQMSSLHDAIETHIEPHIQAYKAGKIGADDLGHRIVKAHALIAKETGHDVGLIRKLINDHVDSRLDESTDSANTTEYGVAAKRASEASDAASDMGDHGHNKEETKDMHFYAYKLHEAAAHLSPNKKLYKHHMTQAGIHGDIIDESVELEESKMTYDPISKKMVPIKSIKVKAGGGWVKRDPEGIIIDASDENKHRIGTSGSTKIKEEFELDEMAGPAVLNAARTHAISEFKKGKSRSEIAQSWKYHPSNKGKGNIRFNDDDTVHSVTEMTESDQPKLEGIEMSNLTPVQKRIRTIIENVRVRLQDESIGLDEVLTGANEPKEWIQDFINSKNPKFEGKSEEKRKQMALAAYYDAKRNEAAELDEAVHKVHITFDDEDGKSRVAQNVRILAPSKEHAKRYAIVDAELNGKKNVKAHSAQSLGENALEKLSSKLKGTPWDPVMQKATSKRGTYGTEYDGDEEDKPKFQKPGTEKRGRGRPSGSKSGAKTHGSDGGTSGSTNDYHLRVPQNSVYY